ncbi:MAG: elongation factor P [Candidatus Uhrbacteria bacterium]
MAQTTADISNGVVLRFKGDLYVVTEFQHVNPGKGSAFVRLRMKSITSGKTVEQTLKAGEEIETVEVERPKMQYLYSDPSGYTFMNQETYDQVTVPRELLVGKAGFIKEGLEAHVALHEGVPVAVDLPKKVTLKVTEASEAVRGDTSGNVTKEVTLETGLKARVPMFIKEGESVVLNTDTGEYVARG